MLRAGEDLSHGEDGSFLRRHLTGDQVLHAEEDVGRHGNRVNGQVWIGAMAALALNLDIEEIR